MNNNLTNNNQRDENTKQKPDIDYKNIEMLRKHVSGRGKILPSRLTSMSAGDQRKLAKAIKRARMLALLPFNIV